MNGTDLYNAVDDMEAALAKQDSAQPVGAVHGFGPVMDGGHQVGELAEVFLGKNHGLQVGDSLYTTPASAPVKECVWTTKDTAEPLTLMATTGCGKHIAVKHTSIYNYCRNCGGKIRWGHEG